MSQHEPKNSPQSKRTVLAASGAADRLSNEDKTSGSAASKGEPQTLGVADTFVAPRGVDGTGQPMTGPPSSTHQTVLGASGAAAAMETGGRMGITAPEIGASTEDPLGALTGLPATDPEALLGTVVADRYRLLKVLGQGGMGVVYLAEHVIIEKRVALKVLNEELTHSRDSVSRFIYEAKAASKIGHENIVDIHDFGTMPEGGVFFVMEFLDGMDLSDHLRCQGRLHWELAARAAAQVCRALSAAHGKGIIHRDLKPENVFLIRQGGREDFVKILDFGIAKFTGIEGGAPKQTKTGMIFGTPDYMAPEQAEGRKADHRVDIYALGVILYQLVTGRLPFESETFMGMLHQHMTKVPTPPRELEPSLPLAFDALIRKTLEKDPDQRYQSMQELGSALDAFSADGRTTTPPEENALVVPRGEPTSAHPTEAEAPVTEMAARARGSRWLWGLLGLVLLGGLAWGAAWWVGRGAHRGDSPPAPPKGQGAALALDASDAQASLGTVNDAESPTPRIASADMVHLRIVTRPDGAEVFLSDARLGKTPIDKLPVPRGKEELVLSIRKDGYRTEEIRFTPSESQAWERVLERDLPGQRPPPMDPVRPPPMDRIAPDLQDPFGGM